MDQNGERDESVEMDQSVEMGQNRELNKKFENVSNDVVFEEVEDSNIISESDQNKEETHAEVDVELIDPLIEQFQQVANVSTDIAKQLLGSCNRDLQGALNEYFKKYLPESDKTPKRGSNSDSDADSDIAPPMPPYKQRLVDDSYEQLHYSVPLTSRYSWQEKFHPPLDIIYIGSMSNARETAEKRNKWLIVNILNMFDMTSEKQNSDIWCKAEVKRIILDSFLLWQIYYHTNDAQRYKQFYKVNSCPYIAILDPRTGEKLIDMNKVEQSEDFIEQLEMFLDENGLPNGNVSSNASIGSNNLHNHNNHIGDTGIKNGGICSPGNGFSHPDSSYCCIESKTDETEEELAENWEDNLGVESCEMSKLNVHFASGKRAQFFFPSDSKLNSLLLNMSALGYGKQDYDLLTHFPKRNLYDLPGDETLIDVRLHPSENIYVQRKD